MKLKYVYWFLFLSPQLAMLIGNCWHFAPVIILFPLLPIFTIDFSFNHCTNHLMVHNVTVKRFVALVKGNVFYEITNDFYYRLSVNENINQLQILTTSLSDFDMFMFDILFKHVINNWVKKQFNGGLKIKYIKLPHQICYRLEKVDIGNVCLNSI